jgi:hypothetical protein
MSTDRDTTRVVRSWLDEGVTALPDRVLDAVLDQVPATRQRRPLWPTWRFANMNRLTQTFIAITAVAVVVVVGYNFLPGTTGSGGLTGPSPTPSPTVSPTPSPTPELPSGSLAAGTYRTSDLAVTPLAYSVTVPAGWSAGDPGFHRGDPFTGSGVTLTTWIIDHVYGDGCHWSGTLVPVATKAQLVAALVAQKGGDHHTTPVDATIGGLSATKVTMSLDAGFDMKACNNDLVIRMWPDPGPNEAGGWGLNPGETATVYALEANGRVGVLVAVQHVDSPPADVAALQQMLASVSFEVPVAPTSSP